MAIEIVINGELQSAPNGVTVLQLLKTLQIDPERVAVELDRKILKSPLWDETILRHGSELEIVQFVGGG
jgi:thiamine biosynthesis protein ThiS